MHTHTYIWITGKEPKQWVREIEKSVWSEQNLGRGSLFWLEGCWVWKGYFRTEIAMFMGNQTIERHGQDNLKFQNLINWPNIEQH